MRFVGQKTTRNKINEIFKFPQHTWAGHAEFIDDCYWEIYGITVAMPVTV